MRDEWRQFVWLSDLSVCNSSQTHANNSRCMVTFSNYSRPCINYTVCNVTKSGYDIELFLYMCSVQFYTSILEPPVSEQSTCPSYNIQRANILWIITNFTLMTSNKLSAAISSARLLPRSTWWHKPLWRQCFQRSTAVMYRILGSVLFLAVNWQRQVM